MKRLRFILFALFLTGILTAAAYAQANSIKQISFVFDRYNGLRSKVHILGDNIDVTAQFRTLSAPFVCTPCTSNTLVRLGPALDPGGIISASGTIGGTFYQTLYVAHNIEYQSPAFRVPRYWMKTVRLSTSVTLTGDLGIWLDPKDIGIANRAVYLHNNMNFAGEAKLSLRWQIEDPRANPFRAFTDKYLEMNFAYSNS